MIRENTARPAEHYDHKYHKDLEQYLFKEIGFGEHLQSIHWQRLFGHHLADVREQRVLDIGCGTGWTSLLLAQRGAHVTAVDISPRQIEILQFNAAHYGLEHQVRGLAGDITQMGMPAESFDLCVGGSFLHHLEPAEEAAILREIHRLLVPGGMAIFVEPAVNSSLLDSLRYLVSVPGRPA
ncbi:MAG: class I SAM-dependent methyltransferase, partial [Dehalococcoidia bacterium]